MRNSALISLAALFIVLLLVASCGSSRPQQPEETGDALPEEVEREQEPEPVAEEEVRLSNAFIDAAYQEYSRRANKKLDLFFRAQQRYHDGAYTEALGLVNRALEIEDSADALALKGMIFYRIGADSQAERLWQQALELDDTVFERIILPR